MGLGNRLLPWARCVIYARQHNLPMLATRWAQVPIGSFLRRDAEPRIYANLFTSQKDEVTGWHRAHVKARARKLPEPDNLSEAVHTGPGFNLVAFAGLGKQFQPLNGWHDLVRRQLVAITRPIWREKAQATPAPFIGLHVRRGDFARITDETNLSKVDNTITPLEWFIESLKAVRAHSSLAIPAVVTSDGTPEELEPLLKIDGVRLVSTGSAIGDILLLSRASLLLASGSSFSAWASYLGQMPTLHHPEQSLARLFRLEGGPGQFVGPFDPSNPRAETFICTLPEIHPGADARMTPPGATAEPIKQLP
jgi:hypothetical protein